eukprot:1136764-Pelagomonas_calceolata.AAC.5
MYLLQIIGCMSPPSTVGRHALSTRFTARVRVACLAHPDISSLQSVYTSIIEKVLPNTRSIGPAYLAKAMLEVYGQNSRSLVPDLGVDSWCCISDARKPVSPYLAEGMPKQPCLTCPWHRFLNASLSMSKLTTSSHLGTSPPGFMDLNVCLGTYSCPRAAAIVALMWLLQQSCCKSGPYVAAATELLQKWPLCGCHGTEFRLGDLYFMPGCALRSYELDSGLMSLADAFGHEACRIFRDRLVRKIFLLAVFGGAMWFWVSVGQEALESFDGTLSVVMSTQLRST